MNLIGLHSLIKDTDEYLQLTRDAGSQAESIVAIDTAKPLLLACLHHDLGVPMLIVTPNAREAKRLHERLISWCAPNSRVHLFPELDVLPYEHLTPDSSIVEQRLRVLALLSEWNKLSFASPPLIVTSAHALSQKTVAVTDFASACLAVKKGMRTNLNQLLAQWVGIGYDVTETVETPGTVSKRGGIIDVYSPNNDYPARIEFFGDEVESIRWFDPATQRSVGLADSLTIIPAREMLSPNREQIETAFDRLDLSNCSDQTRDAMREDVE
ncbi:MAG: hypothetical protein SVM79_02825, partial [Chloroflexota bacterium]|nr:hypothetical protein [Chloroflexota bacterium]